MPGPGAWSRGRRLARLAAAVATPRGERRVGLLAAVALAATAAVALWVVPADAEQGPVQRLMFVHLPALWLAYLSFAVVAVASGAYLSTGQVRWDRVAAANAEVGVLFTALTIALGSLRGRPVRGTWWTWDARLTTTVVMLLVSSGYLAVRRLSDEPTRTARWAAVVGIVGFLDVPLVHLSVVRWRGPHLQPTVLRPGGPTITGSMLATLMLGLAACTLAQLYLVLLRMRVGRLEDRAGHETAVPAQRRASSRRVEAGVDG